MSCGWVIGYVCISLCYVSCEFVMQVNKIRSIFQIWVGDECEMFEFDDVNFDGFGERVICG